MSEVPLQNLRNCACSYSRVTHVQGLLEIKGTHFPYRGTSLIRNCLLLGPYSRPMPRAQRKSWGGGSF